MYSICRGGELKIIDLLVDILIYAFEVISFDINQYNELFVLFENTI